MLKSFSFAIILFILLHSSIFPNDPFTNYDEFITRLNELCSSADSINQLNQFWNDLIATENFPFAVDTNVAFLYRGSAGTVIWNGSFNEWGSEASIPNAGVLIGVSDIWILEKEFPADTRCEYKLVVDGNWLADPNNPHPLVGDYGNSELWMPEYFIPPETIPRPGIPKGTLSDNIIKFSTSLNYSCQYRVYLPAGYEDMSNLSVIYCTDGQNYLDDELGKMVIVLDNLIYDKVIDPVIAVFLDPRDPYDLSHDRRGVEYRNNPNFANYVTLELIPDVDSDYSTNPSADARAIIGSSWGGYNSAYFCATVPDYFHLIGMQSPFLHPNGNYDIIAELQASDLSPMVLFMSTGTIFDAENYTDQLKSVFDQQGKDYMYRIIGDNHSWQNWSRLVGEALTYFFEYSGSATNAVEPLINNNWTTFTWPYNAYYPEDDNGINGHVGNGCGPTSMARILHYWGFPVNGIGVLDFNDIFGHPWYCDLTNLNLNYSAMPYSLSYYATPEEYHETANLFLGVGAVAEKIQIWSPNNGEVGVPSAFINYFHFSETAELVKRENYTRDEWINIYKNELNNGRPIMMTGRTADSPPPGEPGHVTGHWWICDGYNDNDKFYINYAYGGIHGYYDIDSMGVYLAWNRAIIGLQPDLDGKEITLLSPNGSEIFTPGADNEISWTSQNISNIRIEYTIDNGENWEEIIPSVSAGSGAYTWAAPEVESDECKIKIIDDSNINIYDISDGVFSLSYNLDPELTITYPNGGELFNPNESIEILWDAVEVTVIKIEYTLDNGTNWNNISGWASALYGSIEWTIPDTSSDQCKIKITDVNDAEIYDESDDVFTIGAPSEHFLGPYDVDANTVLLMHFENNLDNESTMSGDGATHGNGISYDANAVPLLGQCMRIDNAGSNSQSYISIPHDSDLSLQGNWTVEMWFYIDSWGSAHNSFPGLILKTTQSWKSNYFLELKYAQNYLGGGFYIGDDQYSVTTNNSLFSTGEWFHAALVRDASNNKMELIIHDADRTLLQLQTVSINSTIEPDISANDVKIGFNGFSDGYFDGFIDELRISNIARDFVTVGVEDKQDIIPTEYSLNQNFPNPFNPTTIINYGIPLDGMVALKVYDILGNEISTLINQNQTAGIHTIRFNASKLSSGIYIYTIKAGEFFDAKKMLLIK